MLFEIISKETNHVFKKVEVETIEGAEILFSEWLDKNIQPRHYERFTLKYSEQSD